MARLIEAQSRAETEFREIMLPIKEVVIGLVANAMENLLEFMERADVFMTTAAEVVVHFPEEVKILAESLFNSHQAAVDAVELMRTINENVAVATKSLKKQSEDNTGNK